jgi:signal transduction histidine kinase
MSYLLHPPLLENGGLIPAVKWFVEGFNKRSEMNVVLDCPDSVPRLSEHSEMALFRVIQESLSNALRHSGSHVAFVQIRNENNKLTLEIRDQGHGFDTSDGNGGAVIQGVGLAGMRERMHEIGGEFSVQSGTWGTTVQATVPLSRAVAAAAAS